MPKIILKESELIRIIEVAMDLDIYSQPSTVDTNNGNQDEEETIEQIIEKMKEILYMLNSGKQIHTDSKNDIYRNLDELNKTYNNIKYQN